MRRAIANLLLLVFGTLLAGPLLRSGEELPACCRRDGKHQCAMRRAPVSGTAVQSVAVRCAQYPAAPSVPHVDPASAVAATRLTADAPAAFAIARPRPAPVRDTSHRSAQKRGPPVPLA